VSNLPYSPELSWPNGQPFSDRFSDPYFSMDNGLEESTYVFLKHNGIPERWHNWPWDKQNSFCIIETGFGTGLNFLRTWQLWRQHLQSNQNTSGWLHFTSIERFPLSKEQLTQALDLWPLLGDLPSLLLDQYPHLVGGEHHLVWPNERISLTLYWDDIKEALPQINGPVHAWYLDGFAPSKNPEMWSDDLFKQMRRISQSYVQHEPATVATFTSAGLVRRGLRGAGFDVQKQQGFGRKREMLAGQFTRLMGPEQPPYFHNKPWLITNTQPTKSVIVIGAGLAGTTTARALAERGINVLVIDQHGIAKQGSGNPQGGLYIKLATQDGAMLTRFYLTAYQYALNFLRHYLGEGTSDNPYWQQCGMLQLAYNDAEGKRQQQLLNHTHIPAELAYAVNAQEASALANTRLEKGGLFFPTSGWVSPADLCRRLLDHPNISFQQAQATSIYKGAKDWIVDTDSGLFKASDLVLATAYETKSLLKDSHLPIRFSRGQLSYVKRDIAQNLSTVICGKSFIAPAKSDTHCIGATFGTGDANTSMEDKDHIHNLEHLGGMAEQWQSAVEKSGLALVQGGRVGFRCTTPDHLPIVGLAPISQEFVQTFAQMAKNANQIATVPAPLMQGLWLNLGHGAKGLISTPLCAEIIANQITQGAMPIGNSIREALWPGRFLVRKLIRSEFTK